MFSNIDLMPIISFLETKPAYTKPGVIVGPIAQVLGFICNLLFEFVNLIIQNGALAVTIILFTIVVRAILFPLAIKQQKSMVAMRRVQPEVEKIQKKYKGNKDPEIQRKMSVEMSELYKKHKASPFSGCLPLLIQMPILYALFFVMREAYIYINILGDTYGSLAEIIKMIPTEHRVDMLRPLVDAVFPKNIEFETLSTTDLKAMLSKLNTAHMATVIEGVKAYVPDMSAQFQTLVDKKQAFENLFIISMVENSGYGWPGILIPILAGASTFASTFVLNKINSAVTTNPTIAQQQKIMLIVMPFMMAFFAISTPAGVGWYWTISSIVTLLQQLLLNKLYPLNPKQTVEAVK